MSSVKFIPAQMQKYAAHTQKMKNSQLKSTVRYMGKKAAAFTRMYIQVQTKQRTKLKIH